MREEKVLKTTIPFGLRYRCLSMEEKKTLSLVNRECGFAIAAELMEHLFRSKYDEFDDRFWDTVDSHSREQITSIAIANRIAKIGVLDLPQAA